MKSKSEIIQELRAEIENGPAGWSTIRALDLLDQLQAVPEISCDEPPPGLLLSMAICLDHAIGLDGYYDQFGEGHHEEKKREALHDMRKVWHEVVGTGYFKYK